MNRSGSRSDYNGTSLARSVASYNWGVFYDWIHMSNIKEHLTGVNAKYLCSIIVSSDCQNSRFIRLHKFTTINWRATMWVSTFPVKGPDQAKCSNVPQLQRLVWGLTSRDNLMSFWVYVNGISTYERTVNSSLKPFTSSQIPYVQIAIPASRVHNIWVLKVKFRAKQLILVANIVSLLIRRYFLQCLIIKHLNVRHLASAYELWSLVRWVIQAVIRVVLTGHQCFELACILWLPWEHTAIWADRLESLVGLDVHVAWSPA